MRLIIGFVTMRIAISGSHSLGKSTLVNDFLQAHPEYTFEEEPYRALRYAHDIKFAEDQTQYHIQLQLNYSLAHTKHYQPGEKVIFDRCPADFIPYSFYTVYYGHTDIDKTFVDSLYPLVRQALAHLDLIVFIPISSEHPILLENDGIRPTHDIYRYWVDSAFKKMYRDNSDLILPMNTPPKIIEIVGDREARLKQLEAVLN